MTLLGMVMMVMVVMAMRMAVTTVSVTLSTTAKAKVSLLRPWERQSSWGLETPPLRLTVTVTATLGQAQATESVVHYPHWAMASPQSVGSGLFVVQLRTLARGSGLG